MESALSPTGAPVLNSPFGTNPNKQRIVSVTEERIETVETKPGKKKIRQHIDNISAPEYFTKGNENIINGITPLTVFFSSLLKSRKHYCKNILYVIGVVSATAELCLVTIQG